jgi:ectoine hydroxylase-related dioxygenase (phytanoyl-CoA dioxygenase family)
MKLADAREALDRDGHVTLPELIPRSEVSRVEVLTRSICESELLAGCDYTYGETNQRIWCLPRFGQSFMKLAEHSLLTKLITHLLGPDYILSNLTAHVLGPGGRAMPPHWDQSWAPRPWKYPLVAQAIWMLDDFTASNGATQIVTGSHLMDEADALEAPSHPALGPAGSCLVYDGRLLHAAPTNTTDRSRTAILAYYSRSWIRQQENFSQSLTKNVQASFSASRRRLLGLEFCGHANMVVGPPAGRERY